ncbi:GPP34 family phosphoprotein [Verrucosispora sp. TAA-831]|uniref:GPP34 family phosphoprotein n=1 Tax=Verrucosispora sp. TAA-831 TaxID=3422227 RepID=UPI003D6EF9C0
MTVDTWKSSDPPTLADDLLLLLFQPRSGTIAGENTLFYVLAGAVLADLALGGHVATTANGRIGASDHVPPADLLRSTWDYVSDMPRSAPDRPGGDRPRPAAAGAGQAPACASAVKWSSG